MEENWPLQEQLRRRKWKWLRHTLRSDKSIARPQRKKAIQEHLREGSRERSVAATAYANTSQFKKCI